MPDYKMLYFKMLNASEDAIRCLIEAQQECESLILQEDMGESQVAQEGDS